MSGVQDSGFGIQVKTPVQTYRDLQVWQNARVLVKHVYEVTDSFPKKEQYRLVDQMCRAAISIPSNIAEGHGRRSTRDYIRFLNIAYGSLMECEAQSYVAFDLNCISQTQRDRLLSAMSEVARMLNGLINALERKLLNGMSEEDSAFIYDLNPESRIPNPEVA